MGKEDAGKRPVNQTAGTEYLFHLLRGCEYGAGVLRGFSGEHRDDRPRNRPRYVP